MTPAHRQPTMKNKLYNFLDKQFVPINLIGLVSFFVLICTADTNKLVAAVALLYLVAYIAAGLFVSIEENKRSYAKTLQLFRDKRDSSSPKWDGVVRSDKDLEPRRKFLHNRILNDQIEFARINEQIEQRLEQ